MGEPNLFSTAVFHYLHHVAETHELPVRCSGPDLEYQEALPESCLGKLLVGWLLSASQSLVLSILATLTTNSATMCAGLVDAP